MALRQLCSIDAGLRCFAFGGALFLAACAASEPDESFYLRARAITLEVPDGFCELDPSYPAEKSVLDQWFFGRGHDPEQIAFSPCEELARSRDDSTTALPSWATISARPGFAESASRQTREEFLAGIREAFAPRTPPKILVRRAGDKVVERYKSGFYAPAPPIVKLNAENPDIVAMWAAVGQTDRDTMIVLVSGTTAVKGIPMNVLTAQEGVDLPVLEIVEKLGQMTVRLARDLIERNGDL